VDLMHLCKTDLVIFEDIKVVIKRYQSGNQKISKW